MPKIAEGVMESLELPTSLGPPSLTDSRTRGLESYTSCPYIHLYMYAYIFNPHDSAYAYLHA